MNEESRMLLTIASRLLSYPDESLTDDIKIVRKGNFSFSEKVSRKLTAILDTLESLPLQQLQEAYVNLFDWKEKTGLYLTAHEYGDSRKRGPALIQLQKIVNEAGFERVGTELADYMPMLFELLAADPEIKHRDRLYRRLAGATYRVQQASPDDHPYFPILSLLVEFVFGVPTKEELEELGKEREEADRGTMPFPTMSDY